MLNLLDLLFYIMMIVFLTGGFCALFKNWKTRILCFIISICIVVISSSIAEIIIKMAFLNE